MTSKARTGIVALTHLPSPKMRDALRTFIDVQEIDLERVAEQHAEYRRVLERAGATVIVLDGNLDHADAVFIEDTAVVLDELAILASPGAASRRREVAGIEAELRRHRAEVVRLELPATLEGGDVLRVGRTLFVGATGRTNDVGFERLASIATPHGYVVRRAAVEGCLHLKTGCTALPDGTMLVNPRWIDVRDLGDAPLLHVAGDEPDAANVVLIGDRVIMASAFPRTAESVRARGFEVDEVDLSELAKAEGSATCLSILVPPVRAS
jgi:dimethylargininase